MIQPLFWSAVAHAADRRFSPVCKAHVSFIQNHGDQGCLKTDDRLAGYPLKGTIGDTVLAVLCACGHNIRKILATSGSGLAGSSLPCGPLKTGTTTSSTRPNRPERHDHFNRRVPPASPGGGPLHRRALLHGHSRVRRVAQNRTHGTTIPSPISRYGRPTPPAPENGKCR